MRQNKISNALQPFKTMADRRFLRVRAFTDCTSEKGPADVSSFSRTDDHAADQRGPNRMMVAPITQSPTPIQSDVNGRTRSITPSQAMEAMM